MSVSERLKGLLEEREWSTRRFQEEVKERAREGTRGVSYASVYEYVEGRTEPPLSFLRVAAEVLEVREGWLATGEGFPTDGHAAETYVAGLVAPDVAERVLTEIRLGFVGNATKEGDWLETDAFARAALVHAWRRKYEGARWGIEKSSIGDLGSPHHQGAEPEPVSAQFAREIGTALRSVLDALNVEHTRMSQDAREDFVMGMAQAIKATASVPLRPLGLPRDTGDEVSLNEVSPGTDEEDPIGAA